MDIKMMHEMIEKLTECAKAEMDKKGIEELDSEEFGKVADIIKDLAEAMYYRTLTEAMKESEYGEEYDEYGPMDDGRRGYRGQPRSKTSGRFMSRGDGRRNNGGRRGYEEPIYHMTPEMYRRMPMEWERDMDRDEYQRMYYSGSGSSGQSSGGGSGMSGGNMGGGSSGGSSGGGSRGYEERYYGGNDGNRGGGNSRYENARRGYEEKKSMGADKQEKMKSLEEYMKELGSDLSSLLSEMSPEEKTMVKSKLSMLAQKVS